MNNTKSDSRKKSFSEAFVNSFGAFPIGYGIGILILPVSVGWLAQDPLTANIFITLTYATVSFVRIYILRRIFTKFGYDDNFIKAMIKLCQRGASIIKSKERENEQEDFMGSGERPNDAIASDSSL